jgi:hypothetical protein
VGRVLLPSTISKVLLHVYYYQQCLSSQQQCSVTACCVLAVGIEVKHELLPDVSVHRQSQKLQLHGISHCCTVPYTSPHLLPCFVLFLPQRC